MLCLSCVSATLLRDAAVYSDVVYCNFYVCLNKVKLFYAKLLYLSYWYLLGYEAFLRVMAYDLLSSVSN